MTAIQAEKSIVCKKKLKRIVQNSRLKRIQQIHAIVVSTLAHLGVSLALILLFIGYPIGTIELGIFVTMAFLTTIGIVVGFHRHFTHRSFRAVMPVRVVLGILGSMAGQGNVTFWVALHRFHHECSDTPDDPHSPYFKGEKLLGKWEGLWHSYMGWTVDHKLPNPLYYAPDILRDKVISRVSNLYFLWIAIGLIFPTVLAGILTTSWLGAFYGFLWGGLVRIFVTQNLVWSITSIAHIIGDRPLASGDRSTNNIWIAIPTLGDSWHNNHHAFPHAAIVGWEWWQIDIAGWMIRALEKLGWAWDLKVPTARMIVSKQSVYPPRAK
jgi:stearoyl-CoA desaturase (delta-9 desaturase)